MEEARQPDSTHSMLRGDSSIQLSFSRVQSPRTYLVPSWHQTPNMSLGKLASAAAAGVANAVRATVFKRRFTGTSRQRKGHRLYSEAARAVVAAASDKAASALPFLSLFAGATRKNPQRPLVWPPGYLIRLPGHGAARRGAEAHEEWALSCTIASGDRVASLYLA